MALRCFKGRACFRGGTVGNRSLQHILSGYRYRENPYLIRARQLSTSAFGGSRTHRTQKQQEAEQTTSAFLCTECGFTSKKWFGQCPSCHTWGTLKLHQIPKETKKQGKTATVRRPDQETAARLNAGGGNKADISTLQSIENVAKGSPTKRRQLFSPEIDRVLGGGLMAGSVNLITGSPGIGKSTLLMQLAVLLSGGHSSYEGEEKDIVSVAAARRTQQETSLPVVYISGEESVQQLKDRADRLHNVAPELYVVNQTNVDDTLTDIIEMNKKEGGSCALSAVIVDSIQAMYMSDIPAPAGTITQIRECALQFLHFSKSTGIPVFLVGHVTKSGDIAGPKVLEHMVDTVLSLEGDSHYHHRILRSIKNRFGSTTEVAFLDMDEHGLSEISNPGELFLSFDPMSKDTPKDIPSGAAVTCSLEGSRPLCVEIQALATPTPFEYPKHRSSGISLDRLHMLLAVLSKHAKIRPHRSDIFLNAVGGLKLVDPSIDLAAALAVASSIFQVPLPMDTVFIGEVGLGGELRTVLQMETRLETIRQLGFRKAVVAKQKGRMKTFPSSSVEILQMNNIGQVLKWLNL